MTKESSVFEHLPQNSTQPLTRTALLPALLGGLVVAVGLAAPSVASAGGDESPPPITLPASLTIPPPTVPVIALPPDVTIPPPTDPVIVPPPDVTIPPPTDPVIVLPPDVTIPPPTDPVITSPPDVTTAPPTTASVAPPPPPPAPIKPSAPQSPVAKPLNAAAQLTWTAPASNGSAAIDAYAVQRATSSAGPFGNVGFPTTTSFTNSGLTNGTKYYFRILAHNAVGWGAPSAVVSATPMTSPSAPQALVATPVKYGIKLTWQAPASNGGSPIIDYRVIVYTADCTSKLFDYFVSATTSTPAFSDGSARCFRVEAHNAVGGGALSAKAKAKAGRPTPPASCSISVTETPSASSDALTVWWNPPASWGGYAPASYKVVVTDGFFTYEQTVSPNDLSTTFYVGIGQWTAQVWAVNTGGWGWPACTTSPVQVDN
jgi:fibronectin type III domain protein